MFSYVEVFGNEFDIIEWNTDTYPVLFLPKKFSRKTLYIYIYIKHLLFVLKNILSFLSFPLNPLLFSPSNLLLLLSKYKYKYKCTLVFSKKKKLSKNKIK